MRLAIADDEALVRSFVRSLVLEARPDTVVLEACDGVELMTLVEDGKVDAALVDIRMPKMDGFASLAALREAGRRLPWFVLSSHSDFSYAKRAIELGALGYALKPPSPEEIRAALDQLGNAIEEERAKIGERFERDWALFATGKAETPPDLGKGMRYSVALVCLDGEIGRDRREKRAIAMARMLEDRARRYADEKLRIAAIAWDSSGDIGILAAFPSKNPSSEAAEKRFWNEVPPAVEAEADGRLRALTLISGTEPASCKAVLSSLRELAELRALLPGGALTADRARSLLSVISTRDLASAERASVLIRCLRDGDLIGLKAAIRDYFAAGASNRNILLFLKRYLGVDGVGGSEPELRLACERAIEKSTDRASEGDTISSIEDYIRRRYAEHISVVETARLFGLSPNYLSSLFHKRIGVTFVQYVTDVRLLKAKEALREGRSVKETARDVGYGSERHFTRLYRKHFGHAPAFEKKNATKS